MTVQLGTRPETAGGSEPRDLYSVALEQFDIAANVLGLEDSMRKILRQCQRELIVSLPVEMDDGSLEVFTGYRVQHNTGPGPTKGGVRYHESVNLSEVKALSMWMTWKCAVAGLPYRAAEGGITVNPKQLSLNELKRLTRRYTTEISFMIGPDKDIPAPDVNTTPQVMAWIMDTYSTNLGYTVPSVVTGKPILLGGSEGRAEATGRGCVFAIQEAVRVRGLDLSTAKSSSRASATSARWPRGWLPKQEPRLSRSAKFRAGSTTARDLIFRPCSLIGQKMVRSPGFRTRSRSRTRNCSAAVRHPDSGGA